jgi:hypothetical protein
VTLRSLLQPRRPFGWSGWVGAAAASLLVVGCGSSPLRSGVAPSAPSHASERLAPERFRAARADWRRRAREAASGPSRGEGWAVTTSFAEGRTGLRQSGRGALAVRRPDSLRLQIVGAAGKLALDVWVGPSGSRVASPLLQFVERAAPGEHEPGRPTGFLTFWMLHRFEGRLLATVVDDVGRETLVLRAPDGALLRFRFDGDVIRADRHTRRDDEHVEQSGGACGRSVYTSADVQCTGALPPPKPRAFEDPDAAPPQAEAP